MMTCAYDVCREAELGSFSLKKMLIDVKTHRSMQRRFFLEVHEDNKGNVCGKLIKYCNGLI